MPIRGIAKNWARSPPRSRPSACSTAPRVVPRRLAIATVASSSTRSGSCHSGNPAAMSPPRISTSSSWGARVLQLLKGIDREGRAVPLQLHVGDGEALVAGDGQPAQLQPMLGAGLVLDRLVRRDPGRDQQHPVEPELAVGLLGADQMRRDAAG